VFWGSSVFQCNLKQGLRFNPFVICFSVGISLPPLSLLCHRPNYYANTDDEGSEFDESYASAESVEEPNHHLLTAPSGDVAFLKEKPVRLARELM
jgi:hypothetical protein